VKVVILAGGLGTRFSEETTIKPKPLIEIGGKPIIWHIMKIYSAYGLYDFIICLGYKGYMIKDYFQNYLVHNSDLKIDLKNNKTTIINEKCEPWKIELVDTGQNTMTGGRLKRVGNLIQDDFCFTYGDGVSDVNINDLISYHKSHDKIATVTAVSPPGRFGIMKIDNESLVTNFDEKPINGHGLINGGFFVMKHKVLDYINDDSTIFEQEPMMNLARDSQLKAYNHTNFWQCMDNSRDKLFLDNMVNERKAPWMKWNNK
tara:strand:- start:3831 stop:4607 length:777 start_codon:yes stop_codon:yes gene_type:complete